MKRLFTLSTFLLLVLFTQAQVRYLQAVLSGANETPSNASTASGVVIVKYNTATNGLTLIGDYLGLSTAITGSHIHQAPAGSAGPVIVHLVNTGGLSGTLSSAATLTDAQETALLTGNTYVNVHSATFPGGEIRGQLMPTTDGQTEFLGANLQGAQEVPPRATTAMGSTYVLLDKGTNTTYVTGRYLGLTTPVVGSHVHTGIIGSNGPVIIPLTNSGGTSGVMHAMLLATDAHEIALTAGATYANVHSTMFPGGEIRGQVMNLSQTLFFATMMTGVQETPPNASPAKGTSIARYNPETNVLDLGGYYQGLTTPVAAAHIHIAPPGVAGPIVLPLTNTGGTDGTLTGSAVLTDAQETALLAGNLYVNVHTPTYPGGEIRGQLVQATISNAQLLAGRLQGVQETPPSGSSGTGLVAALLDITTRQVFVAAWFEGLGSNAVAAHIHLAPPGVAGGIILPLSVTRATAGLVTGTGTITPAQAVAMMNGNTYLNVHSQGIPSGEVRAQLGNLTLPNLAAMTWYRDWDRDSYGDPARTLLSVVQPEGYVSNNLDCNDYRVFYQDADNDGWGNSIKLPCGLITRTGDCNDNDRRVHSLRTFYRDADGDSWGDAAVSTQVCSSTPPAGYVANRMDCNDNNKAIRYCPPTTTTGNRAGREEMTELASTLTLSASPNPFVHQTRIQYHVPAEARVSIKVYDVLGREVGDVFSGLRSAGTYVQDYNTAKLPSGVYYLRLVASAGGKEMVVEAQKLMKAK